MDLCSTGCLLWATVSALGHPANRQKSATAEGLSAMEFEGATAAATIRHSLLGHLQFAALFGVSCHQVNDQAKNSHKDENGLRRTVGLMF